MECRKGMTSARARCSMSKHWKRKTIVGGNQRKSISRAVGWRRLALHQKRPKRNSGPDRGKGGRMGEGHSRKTASKKMRNFYVMHFKNRSDQ